jgi:sortase A
VLKKISPQTRNFIKKNRQIFLSIFFFLAILGFLVALLPLLATINFKFAKSKISFPYQSRLENQNLLSEKQKDLPEENRLVIPSIHLNEEIFDGATIATLSKGVWRMPFFEPSEGSNTVITGHRYLTPFNKPFYHVDQIKLGDPIIIYWEGREFDYEVKLIYETDSSNLDIIKETTYPKLTLITCTSLFLQNKRLILEADLIHPDVETLNKISEGIHQEVINEMYSYQTTKGKVKISPSENQPLEIKKEPFSTSSVLETLTSQQELEIVGENDAWFKIIFDKNTFGWIPKNLTTPIE